MKWIYTLLTGSILLATMIACSNNDINVEQQEALPSDQTEINDDLLSEHTDDWGELATVIEVIGDDFDEIKLVNDKGGSRVIHYTNKNNLEYKSVFIKREQRLKIISTGQNGDGEIYNEILSTS